MPIWIISVPLWTLAYQTPPLHWDRGSSGKRACKKKVCSPCLICVYLRAAKSRQKVSWLLDELVRQCARVGLILNVKQTNKQKSPPFQLKRVTKVTTAAGMSVDVLSGLSRHKWLASPTCAADAPPLERVLADAGSHLPAWADRWEVRRGANPQTLCDKKSPVACFAAGHRAVHQGGVNRLDVDFCKHLRRVVGPPSNLSGMRPGMRSYMRGMFVMGYWARKGRPSWSQDCQQILEACFA